MTDERDRPPAPPPRREALRQALAGPLPGRSAQRQAWPDDLPGRLDPPDAATFRCAAVLIALFEADRPPPPVGRGAALHLPGVTGSAHVRFPLIRRPEDPGPHGGQIALPGGRCEPGETPAECALREAEEETGIRRTQVEILGTLTPVSVAVSRNRIVPLVGWVRPSTLAWRGQEGEVEEILFADPDRLCLEGPRRVPQRWRDGLVRDVPAWVVPAEGGGDDDPHEARAAVIWGATAIILAEFLFLWRALG